MRIAVVGAGISGLVAAYLLQGDHQVTVFEAGDYPGGHTATVDVRLDGLDFAVDTGFIVFNSRNYPNFVRLLELLGVESQASDMSFSVSCEATGLEYAGGALFAQRANLVNPVFLRMLLDIRRFHAAGKRFLASDQAELTVEEFLRVRGFRGLVISHYLVPMAASIWSAPRASVLEFPARHLLQFMQNHGLLGLDDYPEWRVIRGGSRRYVELLVATLRGGVRLNTPVRQLRRHPDRVDVKLSDGSVHPYDQVVIATHSDQALGLLHDPSPAETEILGAMPYQANDVALHTDESLLPRRRAAWSSWNYRLGSDAGSLPTLTYHMNRLQGLAAPAELCVTLNSTARIRPERLLRRFTYDHPLYTLAGMRARARRAEVDGVNRTHYCGAYWGWGFHEDGVNSALHVCERFGARL